MDNIRDLENLTSTLIRVINANSGISLSEQDAWKLDAEQLAKKMVSHALSVLDLLEGTKPNVPNVNTPINFIDYISIFNIVRSALETYYVYFYVLGDNRISDEIRNFRRELWHGSSISSRQRFVSESSLIQSQLLNEANLLTAKLDFINASPLFTTESITQRARDAILRRRGWFDWKPIGSWRTIASIAGWRVPYFSNVYSILSAVSHSDATVTWQLSNPNARAIQLNQSSFAATVLNVVLACFIRDYAPLFTPGNTALSGMDSVNRLIDINTHIASHA